MPTNYIWGGTTGTIVSRHGPLTKGDVVALTDEEVLSVAGNPLWSPKPSITDKKFLVLDDDATLTTAQSGLRVVSVKTSAAAYTLPASPSLGHHYEFQFGPGAVGDITVDRNGKTMDGGTSNLTLAIATVQCSGVYYDGTGWVSYTA